MNEAMRPMVVHPETGLTVAVITSCRGGRRWMLMLWDGQGEYMQTQWHRTRRDALAAMTAHCTRLGVPLSAL